MRMTRKTPVLFLILLVTAIFLGCFISTADAKSYSVDFVTISARLAENGNMTVVERRTFKFDGAYNYVYWTFPESSANPQSMVSVKQTDDVTTVDFERNDEATTGDRAKYSYINDGFNNVLTLYNPVVDETVTYEIEYTVEKAVTVYSDTAELYWKFIGPEWSVATKEALIDIAAPSVVPKNEVRAWAHGPLNGTVEISDDGIVTLAVNNVPSETFVEGRVMLPTRLFPQAEYINEQGASTILAQEKTWAEEANQQRTAARWRIFGGNGLGLAVALGLMGVMVWMFLKHGVEYKPEQPFQGKYWREDPRPDLTPALIGAIWRMGETRPEDAVATLIDLTDRGLVTMTEKRTVSTTIFGKEKVETDLGFRLEPEKRDQLSDVEKKLFDFLFMSSKDGKVFTFADLKHYAKEFPEQYSKAYEEWKRYIAAQVEVEGFIEADSVTSRTLGFVLLVGEGAVVAASVYFGLAVSFVVSVLCAIAMVPFIIFMKRRSQEGNELYHRYEGLRRFLKDFSRMHEAPPKSVAIWNRYLVLAAIFGITEEVTKQLEVAFPEIVQDQGFATSYIWFYGVGPHMSTPFSAFNTTFASSITQATTTAMSAAASAGGLGGGFSGGGGFGGGGGGGGAG